MSKLVTSGSAAFFPLLHAGATDRDCRDRDCRACQNALQQSSYAEIRQLTCVCDDDDRIQICGHVSSYFMKQQAQETILSIAPPSQVTNSVSVSGKRPR